MASMVGWSRSRASFWVKGESSGHVQELVELVRGDAPDRLARFDQALVDHLDGGIAGGVK
mgnify:CR=1 FL=1